MISYGISNNKDGLVIDSHVRNMKGWKVMASHRTKGWVTSSHVTIMKGHCFS